MDNKIDKISKKIHQAIMNSDDMKKSLKTLFPENKWYLSRSINELAKELESIEMWLNEKNVPTHDKDGNKYSYIGRIEQLIKK